MKDARPQLPSGNTPRMFFARCVWWCIWGGRFPFGDTDTVRIEHSNDLYFFHAKPSRGGGSTQFVIRGEYNPTATYKLYDVCVISAGANAGTYVCISPCTGVHPTIGAPNWMQLPMGTVGAWV